MIKTPLSTMIGGAFWTPSATILGSTSKTFDQLIKSLFVNGEQGFVYDPNDLSTMFQDSAGTVPVTGAGQPVGLMLDKSKGLLRSEELLVNGDFSSNVSWSIYENMSFSEGKLKANSTTNASVAQTAFKAVVGKCYELTVNLSAYTKGPALVQLGGQYINFAATGIYKRLVIATTATSSLEIIAGYFGSGGLWEMDSISVREVYGNHAYQTQSAMRPLLVASPQHLDYDTADDKLITTLPAQLTGCTVVRSVPNVGTQILTNQTIPTTYNDNTDHCGLIVINRALTATETSLITKLFNKAAGV